MSEQKQQQRKHTFEERAEGLFFSAIQQICQQVPELRSVGIVFDWQGRLNDAALHGMWCDAGGKIQVHRVEVLHGSIAQTHKLLQLQTSIALHTIQVLQATLERAEAAVAEETAKTLHETRHEQASEEVEPQGSVEIPAEGDGSPQP